VTIGASFSTQRSIKTPSLPSQSGSSQKALPAVRIDRNGKLVSMQLHKKRLVEELELPLRDLRIVDPHFPNQIQASFRLRPNIILFSIENIKIIIKHDELLVFSPFLPEVQEFIPALQQQIAILENSKVENKARFEHIVLETALHVVCGNLQRRVSALSPAVDAVLRGMTTQNRGLEVVQTQVDELLPLKNKLDELNKRINEIKRVITMLDDEDIEMMYLGPANVPSRLVGNDNSSDNHRDPLEALSTAASLSSPHVSTNLLPDDFGEAREFRGLAMGSESLNIKHERIAGGSSGTDSESPALNNETVETNLEILLENYLNEIEWISAEMDEILDEITNSEENLVLQLDIIRNRMLRFELLLSISSFVVGCGALVTGAFGMNLLSHLELRRNMFWSVSAGIIVGMVTIGAGGIRYARRQKLF
jgi:hypothetical protein